MKVVPIISSIIIIVGCFLPWIQIGALFANRGIDNPDGALALIVAVIAGGTAFYNYSKEHLKHTWIYLVVGAIGLVIAYYDISEVTSRAEAMAESIGKLNTYIGGNEEISMTNFVGSGLYVVCLGSTGLILSGLGVFKSVTISEESTHSTTRVIEPEVQNTSTTKKCPDCAEIVKAEARICRFCNYKFIEDSNSVKKALINKEEEIPTTNDNELLRLRELIVKQQNKIFGGGMTDEISQCIEEVFTNAESSIYLLVRYHELNRADLIEDIIKLDSSYNTIRDNVQIFIDLGLIESDYPHKRK